MPEKRIWVSEMGWTSDAVGEDGQADALEVALGALSGDDRLALATWFCLQDWTGESWGLYRTDGSSKPALDRFREVAWLR